MSRLTSGMLIAATLVLGVAAGAAQSVNVVEGNVVFVDAAGHRREITQDGAVTEAILSPDQQSIAYLKTVPGEQIHTPLEDRDPQEIWFVRVDGGSARKLTESVEGESTSRRAGLSNLQFAPDGRFLYFESICAAVSHCVHQTNMADGTTRSISGGSIRAIIASGHYRGHVVVGQHRYYPCSQGGSYEEMFLISPSGDKVFDLGPDDPATLTAFETANRSSDAEAKVRAAARPTSLECPPDS